MMILKLFSVFKGSWLASAALCIAAVACAQLEDSAPQLEELSRDLSTASVPGSGGSISESGTSSEGEGVSSPESDGSSSTGGSSTGGSGTGGSGTDGSSTGGSSTGGSSTGDDELESCSTDTDCAGEVACSQCLFGADHGYPELQSYACIALETQIDCGSGCVDTTTDSAHCGACETACAEGSTCEGGVCLCSSGEPECTDGCFDLTSDLNNCGSCGTICEGDTPFCRASTCEACEVPGDQKCDGSCVDTQSDTNHCGSCDNTCEAGQDCISGSCGCTNAGEQACGGTCVDTNTNNSNCGSCGNACTNGDQCVSGECYKAACIGISSYNAAPFSGNCNNPNASRRIHLGKLVQCGYYVNPGTKPQGGNLNGSSPCTSKPWCTVTVCAR